MWSRVSGGRGMVGHAIRFRGGLGTGLSRQDPVQRTKTVASSLLIREFVTKVTHQKKQPRKLAGLKNTDI